MAAILIDGARRKRAIRHGGDQQRVDLPDMELAAAANDDQLAINDALEKEYLEGGDGSRRYLPWLKCWRGDCHYF